MLAEGETDWLPLCITGSINPPAVMLLRCRRCLLSDKDDSSSLYTLPLVSTLLAVLLYKMIERIWFAVVRLRPGATGLTIENSPRIVDDRPLVVYTTSISFPLL
jgi:hypothetical protein